MATTCKVFINYRRSEDIHAVGRLADKIRAAFAGVEIFLDTDAMPVGTTIAEVLDAKVRASDIVLVAIGPRWTSLPAADGGRRLDDTNDYVRQEVAAAIAHGKPIVPLLIDGARMPSADELPENIRDLATAPGFPVRGDSFGADITRLLTKLEPLIKRGSIAIDVGPPGGGKHRWIIPGSGRTEWFKDFEVGPELVVVPAGSFTMGSPIGEVGREPDEKGSEAPTRVEITKPFAVGRFAITRHQFEEFVADTRYKVKAGAYFWNYDVRDWVFGPRRSWEYPGFGFQQTSRHPVVAISWSDAQQYASWASRKGGRQYRLLTAAEWEFVARASTSSPFWWGHSIAPSQANYDARKGYGGGPTGGQRAGTQAVDSYEPNPWGLYQVHGNVCEFCADSWPGQREWIMCKGGSFEETAEYLRSGMVGDVEPDKRYVGIGFRIARDIE